MKDTKASHLCQRVVSSTLPGISRAALVAVVTCPTSGTAILTALNCKTHNPPLTSALSSLLAIMIMWILIDQGDYYHSLNILLYCPTCLNLENSKQVIMKERSSRSFSFYPFLLCPDVASERTTSTLAEECEAILKKTTKNKQDHLK